MNITFLKNSFPSYTDFFKLVYLSGFETKNITEITEQDYIIAPFYYDNGHLALPKNKGKIVLWYLERIIPFGTASSLEAHFNEKLASGVSEIWVSDSKISKLVKNTKFVPLGIHENLSPLSLNNNYSYDVADMCYRNERRHFINHLPCRVAPVCMPPQRDNILATTKFMLNVHQDSDDICEPLRFAVATASGIPIISEKCYDAFPYAGESFIELSYHEIQSSLNNIIQRDYSLYKKSALEKRNYMLDNFSFKKCVLNAIGQ